MSYKERLIKHDLITLEYQGFKNSGRPHRAAPISKVDSHKSDKCEYTIIIPDSFLACRHQKLFVGGLLGDLVFSSRTIL